MGQKNWKMARGTRSLPKTGTSLGGGPPSRPSLRETAEATPASRDRYVDFLRAFSIIVVVLGHWLIAIIYMRDGQVTGMNALDEIPGLWLATWVLQVMPVFFFVGGFSNLVTLDAISKRGGGYGEFIRGRVHRLMRPTLVFLAVWIPISIAADVLTPLSDRTMELGTELLTRPLWFIGIYMIMIALAPPMLALHRRYGFRALVAMVAGAAIVDGVAVWLDVISIGYLNFAFVWLFVHQLGYFYADGSLGIGRTKQLLLATGGLIAMLALTIPGWYSPSMVGLVGERSNTNPPTIAIVALTIWQVGLVMLIRAPISRALARARAWMAVIFLNSVIMTMFLWHQTAMLIAVGILYPLGFPQPVAGTAVWWAVRPLWIGSLAIFLTALVTLFGRFERGSAKDQQPITPAVAAVGTGLVLLGILGLAVTGFDRFTGEGQALVALNMNPLQSLVLIVLGTWILRQPNTSFLVSIVLVFLAVIEAIPVVLGGDALPTNPFNVLAGSIVDALVLTVVAAGLLWSSKNYHRKELRRQT